MEEIWKPVKGFEGKYEISSHGRVMSFNYRNEPFLLSPQLSGAAANKLYYKVTLGRGNGVKVHRLVATHFLENPHNKPCINHIDGNKLNNHFSNLEFCTYAENNKHAWDTGLKEGVIVLNTETGIYYEVMRDAAFAHNLRYKNLSRWMNGTRKNKTSFICV